MVETVYIVDVKSGNLKSLLNAIKHLGEYEVKFIQNSEDFSSEFDKIKKLIFPGVGNFGHFIRELHERNLEEPIRKYIQSGRPLMGICVGLQTLFKSSEESSEETNFGLGYLDLNLKRFNSDDPCFKEKKLQKSVPHIGWNSIYTLKDGEAILPTNHSLYGINTFSKYYFVHSYAAILGEDTNEVIEKASKEGWSFAFTRYGSENFLAAISYKNIFATQFHPEKSGVAGLKVIQSFLKGERIGNISEEILRNKNDIESSFSGLTKRVIACLDVRSNDEGDLVVTKGDQYDVRASSGDESQKKVRNLGKPVELATRYYHQGADEITFLNITSFRNSPLKDLPMLEVLTKASENIFVPLTVGGGIKDMVDPETGKNVPAVHVAHLYFMSGADKVSIGSDAVKIAEEYYANKKLKTGKSSIETISATFGNQAVVISVDPKVKYVSNPSDTKMSTIEITDPEKFGPNGEHYCYYQVTSQGGRKMHDLGALELCQACEDLGAGEILLNSIDHDGTNKGFNLQLLRQVKESVSIPVIASSGAGCPAHFKEVFDMDCNIDAALGAGLFHRGEYEVNDVKRYLQEQAKMDVRLETKLEL